MKNKVSVEEQVAQLSPQQQDNLMKTAKIAMILEIVGIIPWLIISVLGLFTLIDPPLGFDYRDYDKLYMGFMIWVAIGMLYVLGIFVFIKVKCPYYSDKKWKYIRKMRKQQNK